MLRFRRVIVEFEMRQFYVYILSSKSRRTYTGVTGSLEQRIWQHRNGLSEFTSKYRINRLVYFVVFPNSIEAISAEKRIKGWGRAKRVALIESVNPGVG
jgi:putative endonuclease